MSGVSEKTERAVHPRDEARSRGEANTGADDALALRDEME